jgi:hypothetical protein
LGDQSRTVPSSSQLVRQCHRDNGAP